MFSFAQPKQKTWSGCAWHGSVSLVRSLKKSPPTCPAAASRKGLAMRPLHGRVLVALGVGRGEELGDDLDREDADYAPLVVDHRRVLSLALEQVGERVAHHVVELQHRPERRVRPLRDRLGGEVALAEPAERPPLA